MGKTNMIAAGIDVSKAKLDVGVAGIKRSWQVANTPEGYRDLVRLLRRHKVERVGLEATGGYERGAVEYLRQHGYAVAVLQPLQVRAFAQFTLCRAKSDRIDAALIAACVAYRATLRPPPDLRLAPWADRLTFVEQVEEDVARLKVRLEHVRDAACRRIVLTDIKRLSARRAAMLAKLEADIRHHPDLAKRLDLLLTVDGIAERTALALLIRMPELGSLSREQAACLAGLAPFDDDSGQRDGQRHIAGGRARLRKSLYSAALPAAFQWNPQLVVLYRRLLDNRKSHKLALVACARKLLIFANTVLARGTPWISKPTTT
jgi:transposase